jgi:glycosyltransferase involved in cell wall biosynthesis
MRLLARDNRVLWVNSIGYRAPTVSKADLSRAFKKVKAVFNRLKEVERNIFVLNPLALPWQNRLAKAVNRKLLAFQVRSAMRKLGFEHVINWIFNPAAAIVARAFSEDLLIYHCVDEYTAFSGVATESLARMETDLLNQSDIVIVSAEKLLESKAAVNPKTVMVRHGVDFEHFRRALDPKTQVPTEVANLPKPVIGFYGLIADWVDVDLMAKVARHFSHGSMVVLGKATTDVSELSSIPNVHMLGRKPYAELPAYCKAFDVALNPFRINRLTLNANPLKVREYMAAGLPVVATAIPEVECLGGCRIGHDDQEFISQIEEALKSPGPGTERSEAVRQESWAARLDEIRGHLASFGLGLPPEEAV